MAMFDVSIHLKGKYWIVLRETYLITYINLSFWM